MNSTSDGETTGTVEATRGGRGAGAAGDDLLAEVDFSRAKPGRFLPTDPTERARVLEDRVRRLQRATGPLHDELDRVLVLLAWAGGEISEAQAARWFDVDRATLRRLRDEAIARGAKQAAGAAQVRHNGTGGGPA
jgi:hypothetical protein